MDKAIGEGDIAGDLFREAVQTAIFFEMGLMDGKQGAAQQGQRADEIGIAAAGGVFAQAGVLAPVVTVFHAGPMVAHVLEPAFRRMGLRRAVADIVAGDLEELAIAEAGVMYPQRAARMGEIHLHRFGGGGGDPPRFAPAVGLLGQGKKGAAAVLRAR
jgi:hypothetical protein